LRADLLFTCELVFGLLDMNLPEFFITSSIIGEDATVTNYTYQLASHTSDINFSHGVIRVCNILSECVNAF